MILHDADLLPESYAVRLLAALLGVPLTLNRLDIHPGRDHQSAAFLALNPRGTLPVLEEDARVLTDWQAIMAHLAEGTVWAGTAWADRARDLLSTLGAARLHDNFGIGDGVEAMRALGHQHLRVIERHLWFGERAGHLWLIPGAHPTTADIACFPPIALAGEGGVSLLDYPAIRRWCDRVRNLPGFIPMSGIFPPMIPATHPADTHRA